MASVTIASVKKNFGEVPILHGVDIDIQDGSFTVLVGPYQYCEGSVLDINVNAVKNGNFTKILFNRCNRDASHV